MHDHASASVELMLGIALAAGIVGHAAARWLRVPSIVPLLALGVLLGPDLAGLVRPAELGALQPAIVGFSVSIILFDGALHLELARFRRQAGAIRRLVTVGALVTMAGGTIVARLVLGWDWSVALLFGSLVIVTGPTVVGPLLRRVRARADLAAILEAEGILGDVVGATIAVITLEAVTTPASAGLGEVARQLALRAGVGAVLGCALGGLALLLLRFERLLPEGLLNVSVLAALACAFAGSNAIVPETGIITVVVAGLLVGNIGRGRVEELKLFKQQLTQLLLGLLFVLLAAEVRLGDVVALGMPGVVTVAALMVVVRPLTVASSAWGSGLGWREKAFLSWIAPRGIVAAAVASLFAVVMADAGLPAGRPLQATVFLVIATTVLVQGVSGASVARWLGVQKPPRSTWAIVGANEVSLALARILARTGPVVFIDTSREAVASAHEIGAGAVVGNALEAATIEAAEPDTWCGALATTTNDEVNALFVRECRRLGVPRAHAALHPKGRVSPAKLHELGGDMLFASPRRLDAWSVWCAYGEAVIERWTAAGSAALPEPPGGGDADAAGARSPVLPLALERGGAAEPVGRRSAPRAGDVLHVILLVERRAEAERALRESGWQPAA